MVENRSSASSFAPLRLVAKGLCLDRGPRRLVDDLDVTVGPGEALIVTGPNGTGKSTLLRAFAGLLQPAHGDVRIEGDAAGEASAALVAHYVGHLEAARGVLTTLENLDFWAAMLGAPAGKAMDPREALRLLGVPQIADLPFAYLSAGQKRRAALARLLISPRPIWILDEPMTALDTASQSVVTELSRAHLARGGLLIAATHVGLGLEGARELRLGGAA